MLLLKNISKIYEVNKKKRLVLDDINISFDKKGLVCILGPSGVGKTTLLNIIGGLDKPTKGELFLNGISLNKLKDSKLDSYRNEYIGFVFQNYNLINNISVLDNVLMPLNISNKRIKKYNNQINNLFDRLNISKEKNKKPNELSGGQMQRVSIARALINNPSIILCDEPTGALDEKTGYEIMQLLKEISKEKLVIVVTHNNILASEFSDRIIKMKDGKIVQDSKPYICLISKNNDFKLSKIKMKINTILKLSINNLLTKKKRTILTSFGCSIGLIGLLILLSVSTSFKKDIEKFKKDTITSFPISVKTEWIKEKDEEIKNDALYTYEDNYHKNIITNDYVNYIKGKTELTSFISFYRNIRFNLLYKENNDIKRANIDSYYLFNLPDNNYLKENYILLNGKLPNDSNELVLIVNSNNKIDKWVLELFGINKNKVSYAEILNKEFKLINNDNYYKYYEDKFYYNDDLKSIYNLKTNKTLKIVGILKSKENNDLENSFIGYKEELVDEIINTNKNSHVVKKQLESNHSVLFMNSDLTKEESLVLLGYYDIPNAINIYPNSFNNKNKLIEYLDEYNKTKINYTDYSEDFFKSLNLIINGITLILTLFSSISLVVSSIMIAIITYISVLERKKEIGILKSLGARKNDIMKMFLYESSLIGLLSSFISVFISFISLKIINIFINILVEVDFIIKMNFNHIMILFVINLIISIISSLIPALEASKKQIINVLKED